MKDPLNNKQKTAFICNFVTEWGSQYARALASGAFPDMEEGSHVIAKIVLRNVADAFRPLSGEAKELAENYAKI